MCGAADHMTSTPSASVLPFHQLRGRVGRGDSGSASLLMTPLAETAKARLGSCASDDGFLHRGGGIYAAAAAARHDRANAELRLADLAW